MSTHKQAKDEVVVGTEAPRKLMGRPRTMLLIYVVLAIIIIVSVILIVLRDKPLTDAQKQAVTTSQDATKGLKPNTDTYDRAALSVAITNADGGKCTEAYAVYNDVLSKTADNHKAELTKYKTRIDSACSGKATPIKSSGE